ncbi:sensor histidine kinase [uncultured Algibacter sp.]|uniref:tetratricopeptide repeat-containing sensor histidine kinase n=1 Tax=uncultured Algibacter sp. TaxID=298659 RepID=UPI002639C8B5|nr:sensor histidine kinase [uncultured Algibacter sp.]
MIIKIFFTLALFCSTTTIVFSQNLDSLLVVARHTKNDSVKVSLYNKVGFYSIFNDLKNANQVLKQGIQIAKKKNEYIGLSELINTYGIYMDVSGKSDSAKYYFNRALQLSKEHQIPTTEVRCLNNLGMFNWNRGEFKEAQDFFFKALKMYEVLKDEKSRAIPLSNIGLIYQELNMVEEALEYHLQSLKIRKTYSLKKEQTNSYNNIGICLKELKRFDEAFDAYTKGLEIGLESGNLLHYYKILENIGTLYDELGQYNKALEYYNKSYDGSVELKSNRKGQLIVLAKITGVYNKLNKPIQALKYSKKAESILIENPHYNNYSDDFYVNSAESYFRIGNASKARELINSFVKMKDSMFSDSNANGLASLEVKYQTEKKEKQILSQRADLAEKELNLNKKNTQLIGLIILAVVISLLGYLLFKQQKLKNNQLQRESELKEALVKIETQNRLQDQRLRISRDLHDNIGAQLTFIISSIENLQYGLKIKNEKLINKLSSISDFSRDTIYELRDTIWAMNKNAISLKDLQTRISNFIDKADISSSSIQFDFNINQSLSKDIEFTSVIGMNVYRIIQEALNNAIKYSDAKNISVNILKENKSVKIEIKDNGKGFKESETEEGNGLNNIRKRAQDMSANLNIESDINTGTNVALILPI